MRIIDPSFELVMFGGAEEALRRIELAGRTCYKSEAAISLGSAKEFARKLSVSGHESVIEHASITVRFICDRGVSHELVRHRLASFSQESTRYCDYSQDKFGGRLTFIRPPWVTQKVLTDGMHGYKVRSNDLTPGEWVWITSMSKAEEEYFNLLSIGWKPQQARAVLPNSLKTEVVMTANLREWKHILALRASPKAHPQMQQLMYPLGRWLNIQFPEIFPLLPEFTGGGQ